MEKVILTKEQAEHIELVKNERNIETVIGNIFFSGRKYRRENSINDVLENIGLEEMLKAIYIGYEVEPEFKVGDWVYVKGIFRSVSPEIAKVTDVKTHRMILDNGFDLGKGSVTPETVRHATPEEIAQEKERRWWEKHGRDVWELKKGDVIGINIKTITINEVREDGYIAYFDGLGSDRIYSIDSLKSGGYKIVCFAEDRKDT